MRVADLKNKRVTVMGLGRLGGGIGVVKFLAKYGARVLVTDLKKSQELYDSLAQLGGLPRVEFTLGQHRNEDFIERDFIVKNPGIPKSSPYLRFAKEHGIPVVTDMSLFFDFCPSKIIGVTGTKGKSTSASLIYELLRGSYKTFLAGNIGQSPLELLDAIDANSLVILELSSWQLEDLAPFKRSPHVAVVLNIYPDHLNRHPDMQDYIEAKENIVRFSDSNSIAVLNEDDSSSRQFAPLVKGKVYYFSQQEEVNGAFLKEGRIFFNQEDDAVCEVGDIALGGEHNRGNILAAVTVAKIYKIKSQEIQRVLGSFTGIPFRQELVREVHGISFYNDTTATIPEAAIAALKRFDKNIILIAGGVDKELDYTELAREILMRVKFLILLPGSASEKIKFKIHFAAKNGSAAQAEYSKFKIQMKELENMQEAVKIAFNHAKKGDRIILSPGASSFNLFKNEFDRGEQFNKAVFSL